MIFDPNQTSQDMFEQLQADVSHLRKETEPFPVAFACSKRLFQQLKKLIPEDSILISNGEDSRFQPITGLYIYCCGFRVPVFLDQEMIDLWKPFYSVEELGAFFETQKKVLNCDNN